MPEKKKNETLESGMNLSCQRIENRKHTMPKAHQLNLKCRRRLHLYGLFWCWIFT